MVLIQKRREGERKWLGANHLPISSFICLVAQLASQLEPGRPTSGPAVQHQTASSRTASSTPLDWPPSPARARAKLATAGHVNVAPNQTFTADWRRRLLLPVKWPARAISVLAAWPTLARKVKCARVCMCGGVVLDAQMVSLPAVVSGQAGSLIHLCQTLALESN